MPIKSKAQWRALAAKRARGEISEAEWDEMVEKTKTPYRRLPERVSRKKEGRRGHGRRGR